MAGHAIKGIGEKFSVNPVTGTGSLSLPISTTPGRSGFSPQLSLSYDSGAGNGAFGLGWNLSVPSVSRKTDKGLPRYFDGEDSDVFILSGAEDLVPVLLQEGGDWVKDERTEGDFTIRRYRPRIEGLFARIERWQYRDGAIHWRSVSKDNITSIYGRSPDRSFSNLPIGYLKTFSSIRSIDFQTKCLLSWRVSLKHSRKRWLRPKPDG
jgi:hypothetical protein